MCYFHKSPLKVNKIIIWLSNLFEQHVHMLHLNLAKLFLAHLNERMYLVFIISNLIHWTKHAAHNRLEAHMRLFKLLPIVTC